jgi:hypothetical protein
MSRKQASKEGEEEKWETSKAKKLLMDDIKSNTVTADMRPKEVQKMRNEYAAINYNLFSSRLRNLRKQITTQQERSENNKKAHDHDRKLYPIGLFDSSGLPRWHGSSAAVLLKEDLLAGRYTIGQPKVLYQSRAEYQRFPLTVFRRHIHQQIKTEKYWKYYGDRFSKEK